MSNFRPELIFRQLANTPAGCNWARSALEILAASTGPISRRAMFGHPFEDSENLRAREKTLLRRLIEMDVVVQERRPHMGNAHRGVGRPLTLYRLADVTALGVMLEYLANEPLYFNRHGLGNHCDLTAKARAILDGLLLGDGFYVGNRHSASLAIGQRVDHTDWLNLIDAQLTAEGFRFLKRHYQAAHIRHVQTGAREGERIRARAFVKIQSMFYRTLHPEFQRWYPNGKKIVPHTIEVTNPITLAHWYMGDGCVSIGTGRFQVQLATNSFSEPDVRWLSEQLARLGISSTIGHWRGQPILSACHRSAKVFLDLVSPYMVESFRYKVPDNPWRPAVCQTCGAEIVNRTRNARYCDAHVSACRRGLRRDTDARRANRMGREPIEPG